MKSILLSIKPKYVELIASGQKTIEVRKSVPKLDRPFKCYIYCTQGKYKDLFAYGDWIYQNRGKVIGEYVCDRITDISVVVRNCNEDYNHVYHNDECKGSCLTWKELQEYGKGKTLYAWHISNLKIYDKPKELREFYAYTGSGMCPYACPYFDKSIDDDPCGSCQGDRKYLTRPPQSWCYVEVEG